MSADYEPVDFEPNNMTDQEIEDVFNSRSNPKEKNFTAWILGTKLGPKSEKVRVNAKCNPRDTKISTEDFMKRENWKETTLVYYEDQKDSPGWYLVEDRVNMEDYRSVEGVEDVYCGTAATGYS